MEIGTVQLVDIEHEMRGAYLDYAMSVITSRALPDVRDGLKPVQRRILYTRYDAGLRPDRPYKKSAATVGDVLGKYHPHGDSAVYDAMVRMAQDFSMRYPLIDGQGNFGCFTGDTKIRLLDGTERTFAELAELPPTEVFHVYAADQNGRIVVADGRYSRITRRNAQLVELTFDDGSTVRCTPDHRFMLRDGSWKQAECLTIDDSLFAGYFDKAPVNERTNDYLRVLQPATGQYEFVHCLADAYNASRGLANDLRGLYVRHHRNFNRFDNRPANIERMGWLEHLHLHAAQIGLLWESADFRTAQRDGARRYYAENPDAVEQRRQRMIHQNQSAAFRTANGERTSKALREWHAQHPEAARESGDHLRKLWQDPDYRAKMSAALSGVEKRQLSVEEKARVAAIISEKSLAMWQDEAMRTRICQAIATAMADPALRNRLSENSSRLWQDPDYRAKYAPDHHRRMAQRLWADPSVRAQHRAKILRQWEEPEFRAAHRQGRVREYAQRMARNPQAMAEMSQYAATALRQKWADTDYQQNVMRTKIAGYVARLISELGPDAVTPDVYESRRNANWIPTVPKALRYFDSFDELLTVAATHNHRVVSIRRLEDRVDVYDITVDEHHNFMLANGCIVHNSIDGDPAAAYRYTEARPARLAMELLADIDQETVDFRPNFDDSRTEPTVLPSRIPNLVLNGATGIAVGMATNIPPHNLGEVCDALAYLIDHYDKVDAVTPEDLMRFIPGPDFPTGAAIIGTDGIKNAYATGRGRVVMRAKSHVEELKGGRQALIITAIPFQVNKSTLLERIAELVREKRIETISDLRDESDRDGMRVYIELKRGAHAGTTLNQLFKFSQLQQTFGVNMLALVKGEPHVLGLKRMLTLYIEHRREVLRRRSEYELARARHRQHVLEGLRIAIANLDAIIDLIRKSKDAETAKGGLMTRFELSDIQAQAILDLQLRRLAALERQKIEDEYTAITARIVFLEDLLANPPKILKVIKEDLAELKKDFGNPRRTTIVHGEVSDLTDDDLIAEEDVLITITTRGYIKRVPEDTYRAQHRGGRGITGAKPKKDDEVRDNFLANTRDRILFFTDRGRVFQMSAHQVPDSSRESAGTPLANLIQLDRHERVTVALAVPRWEFEHGSYLIMATRQGKIKRTILSEYDGVRPSGLIGILLEGGDELKWAKVTTGEDEIIMVTHSGMALRFKETDVRSMGRAAAGVMAIRLRKGDSVAAMELVKPGADLFVVSTKGIGKRTSLREYKVQSRFTQGIQTIDVSRLKEIGQIADARVVEDGNEIAVISNGGIVMRTTTDALNRMGRATRGVKVMNLDAGHEVVSIAYISERRPPQLMLPEPPA